MFSSLLPTLAKLFLTLEKEGSKNLESEEKIVSNIFKIGASLPATHRVTNQLIISQYFEQLFSICLITLPVQELRRKFCEEFKVILRGWNA